jgi:hypothetical protein
MWPVQFDAETKILNSGHADISQKLVSSYLSLARGSEKTKWIPLRPVSLYINSRYVFKTV